MFRSGETLWLFTRNKGGRSEFSFILFFSISKPKIPWHHNKACIVPDTSFFLPSWYSYEDLEEPNCVNVQYNKGTYMLVRGDNWSLHVIYPLRPD